MSAFLSGNARRCSLAEVLGGVTFSQLLLFSLTFTLLKGCKRAQNRWDSLSCFLFFFFFSDNSFCENWIFTMWIGDEYKSVLSTTESKWKQSKILFWCYCLNSTLVHFLIENVMKMKHSYLFSLKRF